MRRRRRSSSSEMRIDLAARELHQLFPVPPLLVHLLEVADGPLVAGIELERGLEGLDRFGLVGELLQIKVCHPQVQTHLVEGVGDDGRLLAEDRDQLGPAAHRLVLASQRVDRLQVVRLDGEDLVEGVDHHDVELEAIAVHLDHLEQHGDLLALRGEVGLLHALLERLHAGLPALGLLVHAGKLTPWGPGGGRVRHQTLPGVDRALERRLLGFERSGGLVSQLEWEVVQRAIALASQILVRVLGLPHLFLRAVCVVAGRFFPPDLLAGPRSSGFLPGGADIGGATSK